MENMSKFKYVILPEHTYKVTVDDYRGNPYTFEVTGEDIALAFRREKLLDKQWDDIYNGSKETDDEKENQD